MATVEILSALASGSRKRSALTSELLGSLQFIYAPVLLTTFIAIAVIHSIRSSKASEDIVSPVVRGPGGKPLPVTKKRKDRLSSAYRLPDIGPIAKQVFRYLSGFLLITFIVNGGAIGIRAWRENKHVPYGEVGWWPDQSTVVSWTPFSFECISPRL
jgi:hypothetical protein